MNYHYDVKRWVFEAVRLSSAPQELREVIARAEKDLSKFPRLKTFIDNLTSEVKKAQATLIMRGRTIKPQTVKGLVYDFTNVFLQNCQTEAKRKYESDMARIVREQKAQELKDMEKTLEGTPSGIFEEGGVLVDEETRKDQSFEARPVKPQGS